MSVQTPPLKSLDDYRQALNRINQIVDATVDSLNRTELHELVECVEIYENEHFPIGFPSALSAIEFRMDQADLSVKDMVPCFGSYKKTKEVLSGKRELTLSMARSLHDTYGIPQDVLLGKPGAQFNPVVDPATLKLFPWGKIVKRGWVKHRSDWQDRFEEMLGELARFGKTEPAISPTLLRRSEKYKTRSGSDQYAIQAWCMRVANIANNSPATGTYMPASITPGFMTNVATLSAHSDGPLQAQEFLSENGIRLVIERHLPKTYLDGAAFKLGNTQPVIGLTLRHDRLDNFWFTLMHELAHVAIHLDNGMNELFVDELNFLTDSPGSLEQEANQYATESLIPSELWESSDARFCQFPSDVHHLANKASVHPAIVVGRIRYESNNYRYLSELVGQGEVKKQFGIQTK